MLVVTGPTGNVGAEVVRLLLDNGIEFRAAAHDPDKTRAWHNEPDLPVTRLDYEAYSPSLKTIQQRPLKIGRLAFL